MKKRLTFANVASGMALVIALGMLITGSAISGGSKVPGKNGVKSSDIAPSAVRGPDIAANAVAGDDVADLAPTAIDLSSGSQCLPPTAAYYSPQAAIDAQGVVHLQGGVYQCTGTLMFTLPSQFRPARALEFTAFAGGVAGFAGSVVIQPDGTVTNTSGQQGGIHHVDGITYKP
jgi:hypothetical protein